MPKICAGSIQFGTCENLRHNTNCMEPAKILGIKCLVKRALDGSWGNPLIYKKIYMLTDSLLEYSASAMCKPL